MFGIVKPAEFTGCSDKHRKFIGICPAIDVGKGQHLAVAPACLTSVPDVIYEHGPLFNRLVQRFICLWKP